MSGEVRINHDSTKATSVALNDVLSLSSFLLHVPAITLSTQIVFQVVSTGKSHEDTLIFKTY